MSIWIGSPNFTIGRGGRAVELIVVHHMNGTIASADAVFQDQVRDTSAHYGVGRDGSIHQYVDEANTAYHAGNWDINQRSIGIEHEDLAADDYTDLEYETSAALIRDIAARHEIDINTTTIRPHHDFTATACPGTLDINRLINLARGINMATPADIDLAFKIGLNRPATPEELANKDYTDTTLLLQTIFNNNLEFRTKAANFDKVETALNDADDQLALREVEAKEYRGTITKLQDQLAHVSVPPTPATPDLSTALKGATVGQLFSALLSRFTNLKG